MIDGGVGALMMGDITATEDCLMGDGAEAQQDDGNAEYAVSVSSALPTIALNLGTPVALLEALALDKNASVRESVARNPNTPVEILLVVTRSLRDDVRVAAHPGTSGDLLEALAHHKDEGVRPGVAKHRRTPLEMLRALSLDAEVSVRRAVYENTSSTDETRAQAALLGL